MGDEYKEEAKGGSRTRCLLVWDIKKGDLQFLCGYYIDTVLKIHTLERPSIILSL